MLAWLDRDEVHTTEYSQPLEGFTDSETGAFGERLEFQGVFPTKRSNQSVTAEASGLLFVRKVRPEFSRKREGRRALLASDQGQSTFKHNRQVKVSLERVNQAQKRVKYA